MNIKLRFNFDSENECFKVFARRKTTGKWEQIGTCHVAAKQLVKAGQFELLQTNFVRYPDAATNTPDAWANGK